MSNLLRVEKLNAALGAGEENLAIIKAAIEKSIDEKYDGILLPAGEYEVYNQRAVDMFKDMLCGEISPLDYDRLYSGELRNVMFELDNLNNYSFVGQNTVFKFNGLLAPFNVVNCDNITFKGFTVDWIDVPYFTADVVGKEGNVIEIVPHSNWNIVGGEPVVSIQNVDMKTGAQGGMSLFSDISDIKLENGKYTFTCLEPEQITVGESLVLRYIYNFAPAIHLFRSKNVSFEEISLKANPGMGIIGQKVYNVNLKKLVVKPAEGRVMSTNTDATHFINCSGTIHFDDCYFEGMGDDATNVHGFYHIIQDVVGNRVYTKQTQPSQDGIPVVFEKGQDIKFVTISTLQPYLTTEILDAGFDSERQLDYIIVSDDIAKKVVVGDCAASGTEIAKLIFENSVVKNIRGRGTLVQTRDSVIRNNHFEGCTGEGVHICTETGWWEAIATRNIEVSNNKFLNCGFGSTMYCDAVAVVISTNAPTQTVGVHQGIKIVNNEIIGYNMPIMVTCAKDVQITGNTFNCTKECFVRDSENVVIENNKNI